MEVYMEIRHTATQDLETVMTLYENARAFMAAHGNPNQWGPTNWPPRSLIEKDIASGHSYVCVDGTEILAVFYYIAGPDIEPTYATIENGQWKDPSPYGVVHRIATSHKVHGAGAFCINWAFSQCRHLRIDTHTDNVVMQNLLRKLGFSYCGIIYVHEDHDPRLAFEKVGDPE